MNNAEANVALQTKNEELRLLINNVETVMQHVSEYEHEMGDWKASVVTAKIASIKSEATAVGVDLSTWDGSEA